MRRLLVPLSLALACGACAQVWEKRLCPGATYREVILGAKTAEPKIAHILRWSPTAPGLSASTDLGVGFVFDRTPNLGRAPVSQIARRHQAIAAINGDFFQYPYSGDPLGLMVRDGELLSTPQSARACLLWDGSKFKFATPTWKGTVEIGGDAIHLDGFNENAGVNRIVLDTESVGVATATGRNLAVTVRLDAGKWTTSSERSGEVIQVLRDLGASKAKPGEAILIATGSRIEELRRATVGKTVRIYVRTDDLGGFQPKFAVGGGPFLVRSGAVAVDWREEGFKQTLALPRHPRSAVGLTQSGDLVFATVDGREPGASVGVTLAELAELMRNEGCVEAMNLDGGGSSCLTVRDVVVNRPSDGKERPVANAILLIQEALSDPLAPKAQAIAISIKVDPGLAAGKPARARALIGAAAIGNGKVVWGCQGAAWIDQGGVLHPLRSGKALITAATSGAQAKLLVDVKVAPAKAKAAESGQD